MHDSCCSGLVLVSGTSNILILSYFIHTPSAVHPWKDVVSARHGLLELREELQEACSACFIGQQVQCGYGWYDS